MADTADVLDWVNKFYDAWANSPVLVERGIRGMPIFRGEWHIPPDAEYAAAIQQLLVDMHEAHEKTEERMNLERIFETERADFWLSEAKRMRQRIAELEGALRLLESNLSIANDNIERLRQVING